MKFPLLTLISILPFFLHAQTGPAGVGTTASNIVWLKADVGTSTTTDLVPLTQWNDQSGNGNNVTQSNAVLQPLFRSGIPGQLNGMPAVEFDNASPNNDYMDCPDNATLDNYVGMTAFSAVRYNAGTPAGTPRAVFSKRVDPSSQNDFGWFRYTSNYFHLDVNGTTYRMNTTTAYTDNIDYLISFSFDGSAATNEQKMYNGNTLEVQSNNPSANVPNYNSDFHVGVLYGHTGTNKQFNGFIPEIIIYNVLLNPAQRFIVNNYLSSKYNIPIAANDYYLGDTPANGDFDRQVAGIGQFSAGNTNNAFSSSVSGGMGISYVSGFDDGDYVLAGHSLPVNTNLYTDVAVVSGGPITARWQRIWYIDVTNTGTVLNTNVTFDLSDAGFTGTAGVASNYKLLYRSVNSGNWTIVATASSTASDQVTFSGINFNTNDGYYTIGTLDYNASTLPVEWLYFNAEAQDKSVLLSWATASELHSDYFGIERTSDGINYSEIGRVEAAGTSSFTHIYSAYDLSPLTGTSYYRLRQVDLNGSFQYSVLRSVTMNEEADYSITTFPNPSEGTFTLHLGDAWMEDKPVITILSADGRIVQRINADFTTSTLAFSLSGGMYFVQVTSASGKSFTAKQVVR